MTRPRLDGLLAPILTPFNDDLSLANDLHAEHAQRMLDAGCIGLVPFGTTGEAQSVGLDERVAALDALVDSGIPADCLVPGTGLSNLPDTARLTRHALDLGCHAALVLPPFYFKNPADDGLVHYFRALIEMLDPDARILLYHFPAMAGVGFPVDVVRRIREEFPDQVTGIKDSSGDWANMQQLFEIDGLDVYPGSELVLLEALDSGGPGVITATANCNAAAIADVISLVRADDRTAALAAQETVKARRLVVQEFGSIPGQKRLLADQTGDERWANVRPPLLAMDSDTGRELAAAIESAGRTT